MTKKRSQRIENAFFRKNIKRKQIRFSSVSRTFKGAVKLIYEFLSQWQILVVMYVQIVERTYESTK